MTSNFKYVIFLFFILIFSNSLNAQKNNSKDINYIKGLIKSDSLTQAKTELETQISEFKSQNNFDTLVNYVYDLGKVSILKNKPFDAALQLSNTFLKTQKTVLL